MADSVPMTPPTERKRCISRPCSKENPQGSITISAVDRAQNTVQLEIDGCPVTLSCTPQSKPETYYQVKAILLDTVVHSPPKQADKI